MSTEARSWLTLSRILYVIAAFCFMLAAFGIGAVGPVALVPFGLAFVALGLMGL